jgi:hypothetical protein
MRSWRAETPDGRPVVVWRRGDLWRARCGASEADSRVLDVALMEAVRADSEVVPHEQTAALPHRVRTQAARIEDTLSGSQAHNTDSPGV